jgi:D-sedoheptulose 7-phosphate isomerase
MFKARQEKPIELSLGLRLKDIGMTKEIVKSALKEAHEALTQLLESEETMGKISEAGQLLSDCFKSGGKVYACGNGGSLCDATHFAEELSGRFRGNRKPLPASSINDPAHISCISNDFGYEEIFSRYVEAHGRKGDVLLAISTSGTSPNVVKAAEVAKSLGVHVIALTGKKTGTPLAKLATVEVFTPGGNYSDRIQELHIKVIHILVELVERSLFSENY